MEENKPGLIEDVDSFSRESLGAVMQLVRASHGIPSAGDDYELYSSFSGFRDFVTHQRTNLIQSISELLKNGGIKDNFASGFSDLTDPDELTDSLVDCNDGLLERVSALLDEHNAAKKGGDSAEDKSLAPQPSTSAVPNTVISSWNKKDRHGKSKVFRLLHASNILRPQLKFADIIDNTNTPFVPKIKHKPNSKRPLSNMLSEIHSKASHDNDTSLSILGLIKQGRQQMNEDTSIYEHPYQHELEIWEPLSGQLDKVEPKKYDVMSAEKCIRIETVSQLKQLLQELKQVGEFAVDLEAHSYRTFQGITCLMQLSTRTQDYIVDTLLLRSDLHILNEAFTDPNIVKVFHGGDSDIQWLQRDFGVYVVNMFDTGQASRVLNLPRNSLDFLLHYYCGIDVDKKYQLADWRVRPLPEEMIYYAQGDTHYLLYVYDVMRNELLSTANEDPRLLRHVLFKSRDLCLQKYEKSLFSSDSHLLLLERQNRRTGRVKKNLAPQQLEALRLLYQWRDSIARQEDESTGYVLPNHMLLQIAEILPREAQGVLACCNPIPPLLRQHVLAVHQLIIEARQKTTAARSADAPTSGGGDSASHHTRVPVPANADLDNLLFDSPHDFSHNSGLGINLLFNKKENKSNVKECATSSLLGPFPKKEQASKHAITGAVAKNSAEKTGNEFDVFSIYMPSTVNSIPSRKQTKSKGSDVASPASTLKQMLSGEFVWRMKRLERKEKQVKKKAEDEGPKTFGTVVEIPEAARVDTAAQVQVLREIVKAEPGKQRPNPRPLAHEFSNKKKGESPRGDFSPRGFRRGNKNRGGGRGGGFGGEKRPFAPHKYGDDDLKIFQKNNPKKTKRKK